MNRPFVLAAVVLLAASACSPESPPVLEDKGLWNLNIDSFSVTVSGFDSGAQLAMHFHHAHSERIRGVGLIAPRPYDCAAGQAARRVNECSGVLAQWTNEQQQAAVQRYQQWESQRDVQSSVYLASDLVWIFHGEQNQQVGPALTEAVAEWYRQWTNPEYVHVARHAGAGHIWPTMSEGAECASQAPGVGNCGMDAAGNMLAHLYGYMLEPDEKTVPLTEFDQHSIVDQYSPYFADTGYAYVPQACADGGACSLHIALHGCDQSGTEFAVNSGLNRWAQSNRLVVLYPQAVVSEVEPVNPQGCWDWWGYSGDNYATLDGQHIEGLLRLIHYLGGVRLDQSD